MIQVLRLGSPLPSIGEGWELQAVAAAVIGGIALSGGVGAIIYAHLMRWLVNCRAVNGRASPLHAPCISNPRL